MALETEVPPLPTHPIPVTLTHHLSCPEICLLIHSPINYIYMDKKKPKFKVKSYRYFSEDFKKQKVHEINTKKITIREISVLYDIVPQVIYRWLRKYSGDQHNNVKTVVEMESESQKALFYKEQVSELERLIGQKQIEIEFMQKLIELASEELEVDIKKNYLPKLLNGSGKITKPISLL